MVSCDKTAGRTARHGQGPFNHPRNRHGNRMCIMMYVKRCIEPQARPQERREISGSDWAMASARWRARLGSRLGVQSSRRAVLLTRRGLSHDSEAAGQLVSIPLPTSKSRAAEELQPPRCELLSPG